MKARKLTVRKLRKLAPILPREIGHEIVLLLRVGANGAVQDRVLFENYPISTEPTMVSGFTHCVRLPFYL